MKCRGDRLRAAASRLFDAATMERVVDPAIADLQIERWSWAGYLAVIKVMVLCGLGGSMRAFQSWPDEERQVLWRAAGISLVALVCLTVALEAPPYFLGGLSERAPVVSAALMLLPQALAVSLPMALTLGVALGLAGHVSARLAIAVAVIGLVCSIGSVANLGWLVPAANQAFRTAAFERMRQQQGDTGWTSPPRGESELTLVDLDRLIQRRQAFPVGSHYELDDLTRLRTGYHMRWALAFAPCALVLFAMSLAAYTRKKWKIRVAIGIALLGYYAILYWGRLFALNHDLPPPAGAWLPNVVFTLLSAATVMLVRRDAEAEPSALSA